MRKPAVKGFILLLPFAVTLFMIFKGSLQEYEKQERQRAGGAPVSQNTLLWFMSQPTLRQLDPQNLALFPGEDEFSDRMVNQLVYVPENYNKNVDVGDFKTIHLPNGLGEFHRTQLGSGNFQHCPVSTCRIVEDRGADLVVIKYGDFKKTHPRQLVMAYVLESPLNAVALRSTVDLTSTYRLDSDVVAPYGKFVYYQESLKTRPQTRNFAANKTKKVAWFVSNCVASNRRMEKAQELQKFIEVDIYGACGELECPRHSEERCNSLLRTDYKFYLAFENSNCRDYVTEKLFLNAMTNDIVPIVMGGRREDYEKVAPYGSFIHVDDFETVEHLAQYLQLLDRDDRAYNSYFRWKGAGEFINTHYWCRVCAVLHKPGLREDRRSWSLHGRSFKEWWRGKDVCWD